MAGTVGLGSRAPRLPCGAGRWPRPEPGDAWGTLGAPRAVSGPALAAPRLGQLCVCLEPEALSSLCIRRDKALSLRVRVNGPGLILQLPEIENEKHLGFRSYSENLSKAHKSRPCLEGRLGRNRGGRDHESHLWVQWVGGGAGIWASAAEAAGREGAGSCRPGFPALRPRGHEHSCTPGQTCGAGPEAAGLPGPRGPPGHAGPALPAPCDRDDAFGQGGPHPPTRPGAGGPLHPEAARPRRALGRDCLRPARAANWVHATFWPGRSAGS